tara:strand:+ start:209 stop:325 length:117 start_codon:yes stop_codon:yes gene_type:complete
LQKVIDAGYLKNLLTQMLEKEVKLKAEGGEERRGREER